MGVAVSDSLIVIRENIMQRKKIKSFTRSVRVKTPDDTNHFSHDSVELKANKNESKTRTPNKSRKDNTS